MEKKQADLGLEVRMSQKVIRRDGTVEEIPGEWVTMSEEEAVKRYGHMESFKQWLKQKGKVFDGEA